VSICPPVRLTDLTRPMRNGSRPTQIPQCRPPCPVQPLKTPNPNPSPNPTSCHPNTKPARSIHFSNGGRWNAELSSERTRELFSEFIRIWNEGRLAPRWGGVGWGMDCTWEMEMGGRMVEEAQELAMRWGLL
jgi:hypothetical protein